MPALRLPNFSSEMQARTSRSSPVKPCGGNSAQSGREGKGPMRLPEAAKMAPGTLTKPQEMEAELGHSGEIAAIMECLDGRGPSREF